jgi:hypothetical protein
VHLALHYHLKLAALAPKARQWLIANLSSFDFDVDAALCTIVDSLSKLLNADEATAFVRCSSAACRGKAGPRLLHCVERDGHIVRRVLCFNNLNFTWQPRFNEHR